MKRFDTNVRSLDGSFKEAPKVLQPVSVNIIVHVDFGVVYYLVRILIKVIVGMASRPYEVPLRVRHSL